MEPGQGPAWRPGPLGMPLGSRPSDPVSKGPVSKGPDVTVDGTLGPGLCGRGAGGAAAWGPRQKCDRAQRRAWVCLKAHRWGWWAARRQGRNGEGTPAGRPVSETGGHILDPRSADGKLRGGQAAQLRNGGGCASAALSAVGPCPPSPPSRGAPGCPPLHLLSPRGDCCGGARLPGVSEPRP